MPRILLVEDEPSLARMISHNLKKAGFEVIEVYDGETAYNMAKTEAVDLIVLDIMLPALDGMEVCRRLRLEKVETPIIMLTAKDEEVDKVVGLELGADDYMTKPFSVRELVARIKAILRRSGKAKSEGQGHVITAGPITLDLNTYRAFLNGQQIELTLKEFELLTLLVRNKNRALTRDFIMEAVWGYEDEAESRVVDVHISNLRKKIEADAKNPSLIKTVRGIGYIFTEAGASYE